MLSERTQKILELKAQGLNNCQIRRLLRGDIRDALFRVEKLKEYSNMSELYKIIIDAEVEPLAYILKLRRAHIETVDEFLAINEDNLKTIFTEPMCGRAFLNKTKKLQQIVRERQ